MLEGFISKLPTYACQTLYCLASGQGSRLSYGFLSHALKKPTNCQYYWNFPGVPVVKTLSSLCRGTVSVPGQGTKILHAWPKKKKTAIISDNLLNVIFVTSFFPKFFFPTDFVVLKLQLCVRISWRAYSVQSLSHVRLFVTP